MTREEAIEQIKWYFEEDGGISAEDITKDAIDMAIEALNDRPHGEWIYDAEAYPLGNPYGHYDCDQCGESVPNRTNFCPNCGALMGGEVE